MEKLPITLCVVTCNSADRLEDMLKKHTGVVSEILVAVQDSTDDTYEIAKKYADRVFKRTRKGASDPDRNWLFSMARNPRVLYLDDDEYLSPELIQNLKELIDDRVDVYWLKTQNLVDGVDIGVILGDDPHPRLFKRGVVRYKDQATAVDHTFPEVANGMITAFVNYSIVHDRTFDKVKKSNRARNEVATPEQVQMQENFIRSVEKLLEAK